MFFHLYPYNIKADTVVLGLPQEVVEVYVCADLIDESLSDRRSQHPVEVSEDGRVSHSLQIEGLELVYRYQIFNFIEETTNSANMPGSMVLSTWFEQM